MEVTELGISIEVKPLQPENASRPISVTELGIVKDVKPLQSEKQCGEIETVPSLMLMAVLDGIVPLY